MWGCNHLFKPVSAQPLINSNMLLRGKPPGVPLKPACMHGSVACGGSSANSCHRWSQRCLVTSQVWSGPRSTTYVSGPSSNPISSIPAESLEISWTDVEDMLLDLSAKAFLQACQYLTDYLHHFVAFWFPNKLLNFWSNQITGTHKLNQGFLKNPSKTNSTMQVWDGQSHKSQLNTSQPLRLISNRPFWSQTLKRKF